MKNKFLTNTNILLFIKGIIIGIANIIPGVSGGTAAVLLGIYSTITENISIFFKVDKTRKFKIIQFFIVFLLGIASGILLFAKIVSFSLINFPEYTLVFFSLIILISLKSILKEFNLNNFYNIFYFFLGIFVIFISAILPNNQMSDGIILRENFDFIYFIKIAMCGFFAAGAMLIPGISGSLFMLIIGEYYNILHYINTFKIKPLFFLAIGVLLGVILFANIINYLLKNYREKTFSFIFAVILASIFQMWLLIL